MKKVDGPIAGRLCARFARDQSKIAFFQWKNEDFVPAENCVCDMLGIFDTVLPMFDPKLDSKISLSQVTKLPELMTDGRRPHVATVHRWADRGVRGVRLPVTRVGGKKCTTRQDVHHFLNELGSRDRSAEVNALDAGPAGSSLPLEVEAVLAARTRGLGKKLETT